jgi:hypothetical protein
MAIPAPHTVRQAIQSPTTAQFVGVERVTDFTLCFIQPPYLGQTVSVLVYEAFGKTIGNKCRQPRCFGFSSQRGQYETTVVQTLSSSAPQSAAAEL